MAAAPGTIAPTFAPAFVSVAKIAPGTVCDCGPGEAASAMDALNNAAKITDDENLGGSKNIIASFAFDRLMLA
jgi:hypothetical protein